MLHYTENTRPLPAGRKDGATSIREITVWDGSKKVGLFETMHLPDGTAVPADYWNSLHVRICYADYDCIYRGKPTMRNLTYAKTVADAKRKFAAWYAENSASFPSGENVAALPASDREFYPTPSELAGQMVGLIDWNKVNTVLEPSAGKGDLIDAAIRCMVSRTRLDESRARDMFDCVEIDENLRHILTGKGFRVVHDDFLTLNTQKHYDVILMNPPFSNGDEHLLKALSLIENSGGQLVCLLNAETVRNPYTNRRKLLAAKIAEHGAAVRMVENAFSKAQRKSDVEVAIVSFNVPAPRRSSILLDGLRHADEQRAKNSDEPTALASADWLDRLIDGFNLEARAGVALMEEYNALAPYIMSGSDQYAKPLLRLAVDDHPVSFCGTETINDYLRKLRYKYWGLLLSQKQLTSRMTSQIQNEYHDKIRDLQDYDFSRPNVQRVIREISAQLSRGVEEAIMELFETLSAKHSWYPESEKNIHYYNGWATNKAHKVNSKVILPINGYYARYDGTKKLEAYKFSQTISDLERALSYLDGDGTICRIDPASVAVVSEQRQRTQMDFSYFEATFYKKGTCHIKFHPDAQILVDRLNIFAARSRAWLPPCYGKKTYEQMNDAERAVVDDFQGREAYEKIMAQPEHYLISPGTMLPALTA